MSKEEPQTWILFHLLGTASWENSATVEWKSALAQDSWCTGHIQSSCKAHLIGSTTLGWRRNRWWKTQSTRFSSRWHGTYYKILKKGTVDRRCNWRLFDVTFDIYTSSANKMINDHQPPSACTGPSRLRPRCAWLFASNSRNNRCVFPNSLQASTSSSSAPCIHRPYTSVSWQRYLISRIPLFILCQVALALRLLWKWLGDGDDIGRIHSRCCCGRMGATEIG